MADAPGAKSPSDKPAVDRPRITGAALLARALKRQGVEKLFYLMGAPTYDAANACIAEGVRIIDARHEQGAEIGRAHV